MKRYRFDIGSSKSPVVAKVKGIALPRAGTGGGRKKQGRFHLDLKVK